MSLYKFSWKYLDIMLMKSAKEIKDENKVTQRSRELPRAITVFCPLLYLYTQKISRQRRWLKVSAHPSLRGLRRLGCADTFRKCIKPPFHVA